MLINLLGHGEDTDYDLHADIYDLTSPGLEGDLDFYLEEARRAVPPVLELAVGTGRVAIPIAQAGISLVGVDRSRAMLTQARQKMQEAGLRSDQLELVQGDMQTFRLERRFGLVMIPYRAFLHLHTTDDQKQALRNVHAHLIDGGRLAMNFFNPDLKLIGQNLTPLGGAIQKFQETRHPESGHPVVLSSTTAYHPTAQRLEEYFIAEEIDGNGTVLRRRYIPLRLRWIYRFEMEHLLELCGFEIEALYGWFDRRPFAEDSKEMVWVCRKKEGSGVRGQEEPWIEESD